jgi:hypothetical protein
MAFVSDHGRSLGDQRLDQRATHRRARHRVVQGFGLDALETLFMGAAVENDS